MIANPPGGGDDWKMHLRSLSIFAQIPQTATNQPTAQTHTAQRVEAFSGVYGIGVLLAWQTAGAGTTLRAVHFVAGALKLFAALVATNPLSSFARSYVSSGVAGVNQQTEKREEEEEESTEQKKHPVLLLGPSLTAL